MGRLHGQVIDLAEQCLDVPSDLFVVGREDAAFIRFGLRAGSAFGAVHDLL